ncbi:MAG: hypothetical protein ACI9T7_002706, partial [Oleiphilaceae bacterium]
CLLLAKFMNLRVALNSQWGRNVLVLNRLPHQNSQKISNYIINDQTLLRIIKL